MKSNRLNESVGLEARTVVSHRMDLVRQFPLFASMSAADCACIVASAHEKDFSRRQKLFAIGEPVQQIFLLISGCVKVTQFGQNGSEAILRISGRGELIGASGYFLGGNDRTTAEAVQSSEALVWEAEIFESMWERFPILWLNTAQILSERLKELEERFREVSTHKVTVRLSSELVRLRNQVGSGVNSQPEICLSREELAQLTGMTVFTVSRLISQWQQRGILTSKRGAVSIHDLPALIRLSEDD